MTKDDALKLALETLEIWKGYMPHLWDKTDEQAITAIKEALAQPEQAPRCEAIIEVFGKDWRLDYMSLPVGKHKLYTQQYTYNAPMQRKPLTEEEIENIANSNLCIYSFARAIEAAHGIKGEA